MGKDPNKQLWFCRVHQDAELANMCFNTTFMYI